MAFKLSVRQEGDVAIVDLSGRITLGEGWGTLRQEMRRLITDGHKQVLLNMKDVSHIDSAGLRELVGSYANMTNQGGQMKLVHAENQVRDVLQVNRLYPVFDCFNDEAAALRSFEPNASGVA